MYPKSHKELAFRLRREGKSYHEITQQLGVPKSTLSAWLKGVQFSESVKQDQLFRVKRIWARNIIEHNKLKHVKYLEETELYLDQCAQDIDCVTERDLFFLFIGLFWGEGHKKRWIFRISNCNPDMIFVCVHFLITHCRIPLNRLRGAIHLHKNNDPKLAVKYWSKLTGIASEHIRTYLVLSSASKGLKPINTLPHGTFNLIVRKAALAKQIHGWLRGTIDKATLPR